VLPIERTLDERSLTWSQEVVNANVTNPKAKPMTYFFIITKKFDNVNNTLNEYFNEKLQPN
jgi:hypothetical protein